MAKAVEVEIPDALGFLFDPLGSVRYRVAYGGRGGAKSWQVARALLIHGRQKTLRVLCAREFQSSIRDSVHRLLQDQIQKMGLEAAYSVERSRIYGTNGTEFLFFGFRHDPHTIKSLEGINVCWVEEAHTLTKESWQLLTPTIREDGSEIWLSFNPDKPDDLAYETFVLNDPPPNSIVRKVGWEDNNWLTQVLIDEREHMLRVDPEGEAHVWGGEPWTRTDSQVLADRYEVTDFEERPEWGAPLYGADWGFGHDPTVLLRFFIGDGRIWLTHDERGIGWSADETERRFRRVPGAEDHTIRADNARPETINEMQLRGLNVIAAKKWAGSVEDGVEHLRGYERVVIHPRCKGFSQEARLWRYKTDARTGDVLPVLIDANNHGPDALRYGLEPLIRKREVRKIRVA